MSRTGPVDIHAKSGDRGQITRGGCSPELEPAYLTRACAVRHCAHAVRHCAHAVRLR